MFNVFHLIFVVSSKVSLLCCFYRNLCFLYRQDQEICAAVLLGLLPSIRSLGRTNHMPEEMRHVRGSLLQVVSGFWLVVYFYNMNRCRVGSVRYYVSLVLKWCLCLLQKSLQCLIEDDRV